jgi:DNA-binding transcriptional LysR family regulator
MTDFEWDDLRYVLAVATAGSVTGAARLLGVNHTTVLRRVNAFEQRVGVRVFERLPTGYVLTAGGEELIATARQIEEKITALGRQLAGRDLLLSGSLRVTSTDTLMASLLPEVLLGFRAAQPGIHVELTIANQLLNLTRRDADVAIRPARDPPQMLVGRRVSKVAFAVYAGRSYLAERGRIADLKAETWVGPDDSLSNSSVAEWMRAELPEVEISLRADSLTALCHAARAGLGLAALPCYLGDTTPELLCVHPPIEARETALWILTHEDLRQAARVRAFTEFAAAAFKRHRALLEGAQARVRDRI